MEDKLNTRNSFWASMTCGIITVLIVVFWGIYIFFPKELQSEGCELHYSFLIVAFSHLAFFVTMLIGAIITYKAFKIESEAKEKKNDYWRKINLEEKQRNRYKDEKMEEIGKKVKEECGKILSEWQYTYDGSLKTLKSNMELFNDVKKIIENEPEEKLKNKPKSKSQKAE